MRGCQNPFAQKGNNVGIGKLSRRLFLLTLAALLPAAIVLFYNLYSSRLAKETEIRDEAVRAGQFGALEIQRIVSGAENVLIALSAMPVIQQRDEAGCQAYLARVTARLPQFSVIGVTDVHGLLSEIGHRQTDVDRRQALFPAHAADGKIRGRRIYRRQGYKGTGPSAGNAGEG